MSILQAHIASTSRASSIKTDGVEDDVVLCLIELYILAYSDWVMNPIIRKEIVELSGLYYRIEDITQEKGTVERE